MPYWKRNEPREEVLCMVMNPPKQPNIFNTDIKRRNLTQLYTLPKGVLKESYKVWYLWAYRTVRSTEVSVLLEVYVIIVEVQNA